MIPRSIYQTARHFVGLEKGIQDNIRFLQVKNPSWKYRLYDDRELKKYIRDNIAAEDYCWIERVNPKYGVVLADLFRYLIVYHEGGVYLDIKSTCDQSLDRALPDSASYLLSQWRNQRGQEFQGWGLHPELGGSRFGGEFQQWHVVARPNHPFLKATIDNTISNIRNYSVERFGVGMMGVLRVSGPICYTQAILSNYAGIDFQRVDIQKLGFRYSVFSKPSVHSSKLTHYSKQSEPIVLS